MTTEELPRVRGWRRVTGYPMLLGGLTLLALDLALAVALWRALQ